VDGVSPSLNQTETDTNQARRERDRAHRNMLTPDDKEFINAKRRASRQALTIDERNASHRARRHSLTPGERKAMLTKRNIDAKAKRNTPCAESIAMMCPGGVSPAMETSASPPKYTNESDGN